ncbi:SxtJ family membrane protein [Candidatus Omnitrophota bacterium]
MNSTELRKFGFNLGLGLNILGCILFYRHREHFIWFSSIGSFGLISAIIYPKVLVPLKKILDNVILAIGYLVNAVSLVFVFYLVFTPIGILLKLFGKDLLHERINKKIGSYWMARKDVVFLKESYERMG